MKETDLVHKYQFSVIDVTNVGLYSTTAATQNIKRFIWRKIFAIIIFYLINAHIQFQYDLSEFVMKEMWELDVDVE